MNLDNHISELLYHHDCVIVAEFGGFVASYRSAFLHTGHHTISPPSKKIAFNASLTSNDGLLANHVAAKLNTSYSEACLLIRNFKEHCFSILNNGEKLNLDKIGILYLDKEKNIQFISDSGSNYLLDSFGLSAVHAAAIRHENETDTIRKFEKKESKKWWRLLEVIPAAAALALLLLNPHVIEKMMNNNLNSFNPLDSFKQPAETSLSYSSGNREKPGAEAKDFSEEKITATQPATTLDKEESPGNDTNATESASAKALVSTSENKSAPTVAQSGDVRFYVIAGCFKIDENAENFKKDLITKGYAAEIIGMYRGLNVVSCSSVSTQTDAKKELQHIRQTLETGAWIMKR